MARRNGAADSAPEERMHRQAPAQGGPNRGVLGKPAAAPRANGRAAPANAPHDLDGTVVAAVSTAYGVVQDNVEEGRRAAERLHAAARPAGEPVAGAKDVANRLMHLTKDVGTTWVDLVLAVLREADVRAALDRVTQTDRGRGRELAASPITQRVTSRKTIEVTLSPLPALNGAGAPGIAGLHAVNAAARPIDGVSFAMRADGRLELRIEVADDQPAGAYYGAVIDMQSQQPIGTLAIRILA
jgi:hypothetical protein